MIVGINAGFGELIGQARMEALQAHGFELIRQDFQTDQGHPVYVEDALEEADYYNQMRFLYIVDRVTLPMLPPASWLEYRNEPDLRMTPRQYVDELRGVQAEVEAKGHTLWAGCISNLDGDSLHWLEDVVALGGELIQQVSIHRYPHDADQNFWTAHHGFRTRLSETDRLHDILGPRPFLVSEVGYHTQYRRKWFFWRTRLSNVDQAHRLQLELDFWESRGAAACCVYQERDAPASNGEKYGLVEASGAWKSPTIY